MKYVIGIVPPAALETVQAALGAAEIFRLTIAEVEVVVPAACPESASAPDREFAAGGLARALRLEVAVSDAFLAPALAAFECAREKGFSAMVSVLPLEDAVRIRTGERGREAI
jgi:nitrogen regulatory protein PII